jgi:hypothetical protein
MTPLAINGNFSLALWLVAYIIRRLLAVANIHVLHGPRGRCRCTSTAVEGAATSAAELHVVREESAVAVTVPIEANALLAARDVPCEKAVVLCVAQATLLVVLAYILARVSPLVTELTALWDRHTGVEIRQILAVGVHVCSTRCVPFADGDDRQRDHTE